MKTLLLGSRVKVIYSFNKAYQGLQGLVVYQNPLKNNDSLVLLTDKNKFVLIEKCLLKSENMFFFSKYRNNMMSAVKRKVSYYE